MLIADDAYAGSATYTRLAEKLREIFGMNHFLPTHQGRAAENVISETLVTPRATATSRTCASRWGPTSSVASPCPWPT